MSTSKTTTCTKHSMITGDVMIATGGGKNYGGGFVETEPNATAYGCVCLAFLIVCILAALFVIDLLARLWPMVAA